MLSLAIFIILIAVATGLMSGLLGIGGNMISIPFLVMVFAMPYLHLQPEFAMHLAIGSGVIVMVFTTLSGVVAHHKHKNIDWKFYRQLAPYMVIGGIIGAKSVLLINGLILEKIFGIFLLLMSFKMIYGKFQQQDVSLNTLPIKTMPLPIRAIGGVIIGFKSGLLGIGGGTIIIPLMLHLNYRGSKISGTTSVCSFTMGLTSAITFIISGNHTNYHLAWSYGNIYLPAVILMIPLTMIFARVGAWWSTRIPHQLMANIQIILMLALGIKMIV